LSCRRGKLRASSNVTPIFGLQEIYLVLLSMTGHGQATSQTEALAVTVEIRSINSRYLKVSLNCADRYLSFQAEVEGLIRKHIQRGSVHVQLRVEYPGEQPSVRIDVDLIRSLQQQLQPLLQGGESVPLASLLSIPGVVAEHDATSEESQSEWPFISTTIERAVESLNQMRRREGEVMAADMKNNCQLIRRLVAQVERLSPKVVAAYSQRLTTRINQLLAEYGATASPAELVREVGIFAERSDIAEELVRLESHCAQFVQVIDDASSGGRKLDFLTQELLREANTIGSKAGDAEIAKSVVEIKTAIDRIREMVQNVE
jgi:uncharacterized protein (TIGR00255 family)